MEHQNIRVLLVAGQASTIGNFLRQNTSPDFLIHHYDSPQKAVYFLVESKCGTDIILLDVGTVERENAKKVFSQVHFLVAHIPMIILTGATEDDMAMLLVKEDVADNVTRETFRASPEKLKQAIEFTVSRNDILKRPAGRSLRRQLSEEKAATEARYVQEQYLSNNVEAQVQKGIWLNGGYYVHTPRNARVKELEFKENYKNKPWGHTDTQESLTIELLQPRQRMLFKLQGKINGDGTTPSMQLMPYKPTKGPKQ